MSTVSDRQWQHTLDEIHKYLKYGKDVYSLNPDKAGLESGGPRAVKDELDELDPSVLIGTKSWRTSTPRDSWEDGEDGEDRQACPGDWAGSLPGEAAFIPQQCYKPPPVAHEPASCHTGPVASALDPYPQCLFGHFKIRR